MMLRTYSTTTASFPKKVTRTYDALFRAPFKNNENKKVFTNQSKSRLVRNEFLARTRRTLRSVVKTFFHKDLNTCGSSPICPYLSRAGIAFMASQKHLQH